MSFQVVRSSNKMSPSRVLTEVRKAFALWSRVADLEFVESSTGVVDLEVRYETYAHGDGDPFDGPGGTVTTQKNHHLTKSVYIGETLEDGQFEILEVMPDVYGEPWLKGTF